MAEHTNPFVPLGVDAGTWMGFEQRIRTRRFHALIEQFTQAVGDGDREAARAALDEARELRPDSPDVAAAAARLELLDAQPAAAPPGYVWSRVFGAVALLLVGVSLLIGLDWMRTSQPVVVVPPVAAVPALGRLYIPPTDVVVVRPEAPEPVADAVSGSGPALDPAPPRRGWHKVLQVLGVEVRRSI